MFHFRVPWALLQKKNHLKLVLWSYFIYPEIGRISLPQPVISNSEKWNSFYICVAGYRGGDSVAVPCTSSAAPRTSPGVLHGLYFCQLFLGMNTDSRKNELSVLCCSDLSRDFTLTWLKNLQTNLQSCARSRMEKRFMPAPSSDLFLSLTSKYTDKWYFLEKWS